MKLNFMYLCGPTAAAWRAAAAAAEGPTDCSLRTLQRCRVPYRGIYIQHSNAFFGMATDRQHGDDLTSALAAAASSCAFKTPGLAVLITIRAAPASVAAEPGPVAGLGTAMQGLTEAAATSFNVIQLQKRGSKCVSMTWRAISAKAYQGGD